MSSGNSDPSPSSAFNQRPSKGIMANLLRVASSNPAISGTIFKTMIALKVVSVLPPSTLQPRAKKLSPPVTFLIRAPLKLVSSSGSAEKATRAPLAWANSGLGPLPLFC